MEGTMKALTKGAAGPGLELRTVAIPEIGPHDVLVKVEVASICGTDLHIYNWDPWSQGRIKPPRIIGHEFAGRIVELGREVEGLSPGAFVSAESHTTCGTCYQCRTGQGHVCRDYRILGVDRDGCFADYVAVPAASVWVNDPDVPAEICSIQDPLGNAIHTALSGEIVANTVAVFGCGAIGLCAIAVAKAAGAATIYAVDVNDYRLDLARKLGAAVTLKADRDDVVRALLDGSNGLGVDVVLEMSGAPSAIRQAFGGLRNGGRVALLGVPSRPVEMDLAEQIIFKGAIVHGITGRRLWDTWYKMRSLLASRRLDVALVITHRFKLEEFEKGFALMRSGNCGKVVLYP
ncbi:MAG TPA: L-threonine 3-dehydrogenase [Bacillota bacterium]|jgi:threonine 3-dehydrogenase